MKIVNTGSVYRIFDENLKTYDKLPTQSYVVRFNKLQGFFLEKHSNLEINEDKIYGVQMQKVEKVLKAFDNTNRNLGVILSGNKGIGKSLFARILSVEANKKDIPLLIVDNYYNGISSFLESIEQEVMVLFDEFDKTFCFKSDGCDDDSPQTSLLSLFDGVSGGKKLFVITCNEITKLNDYLINRPGRFHYHFRFDYPNTEDIKEYLSDKLKEEYYDEIKNVVMFAKKVDLNYDCLRAIAFELNNGLSFKEAISDLNIINLNNYNRYNITLHYKNGYQSTSKDFSVDLFGDYEDDVYFHNEEGRAFARVFFDTTDIQYDTNSEIYYIPARNLQVSYTEGKSVEKTVKQLESIEIDCLTFKKCPSKSLHYVL